MTAGKSILETVPFIQRKMELSAHSQRSYPVTEYGRPVIEPGLIVVYDSNGQIAALDSAVFYTVMGLKERSDRSFWESLK